MLKPLVWVKFISELTSQAAHGVGETETWAHGLHDPLQTPRDECVHDLLIRWNHFTDFIAVATCTRRAFDSCKAIRTITHG